jgi:Cu/Ag efflux pump CusA
MVEQAVVEASPDIADVQVSIEAPAPVVIPISAIGSTTKD